MIEAKKCNWRDILYAILLPGVFISLIVNNPIYLVFVGVVLYFLTLNKYEFSVVLMIAFPHVVGIVKEFVGISLPASLGLFAVVVVFLNFEILKLFNKKVKFVLIYSIILLSVFFLLYLFNAPSSNGLSKLSETTLTVICTFTAFSLIISNDKISYKKIGVGFLIVASLYLWIAYNIYIYPRPDGLLDFNSFRDYSNQLRNMDFPNISYHHLGYCGLYFISFLLAEGKNKLSLCDFVLVVLAVWITFYAGGRQIMVGTVLIFLIWILLRGGKNKFSTVLLIGILLLLSWIAINNLEIFSNITDQSSSTDEKLNRNWDYAIILFGQHPIVGIGYGNYYNPIANESYPHNIILEILCELGIFGFLAISLVILVSFLDGKSLMCKKEFNSVRGIMIFFPFLLRGFISGSLGSNVQVFLIFFALIASAGFSSISLINSLSGQEVKKLQEA